MQYNSKINIVRTSRTPDGMGGWAEGKAVIYSNLPCRINWSGGSERIFFDKTTYFRDGKVFCRVVDVNIKDTVQYNGVDYRIVNVSNPDNSNRYLLLEIHLVQ